MRRTFFLTWVRRAPSLMLLFAFLVAGLSLQIPTVQAVSPDIVISQVYGGGGNSGALYTHDFVELFNRGATPVSLAGLSIQYASATGTGNFGANTTQITELPNVLLNPGQYYLVQQAQGSGGTAPLPQPDTIDASPIPMSGTEGKVALVRSTTSLGCNGGSAICSPEQLALIIDLVGFGGANFAEGTAAPRLSNTTAAIRAQNGCVDTDNNSADFSAGSPTPRNTSSPLNPCGPVADTAPAVANTTPASGAVDVPAASDIIISFSEPVNVTGSWATLTCSVSGSQAVTLSGGPTDFVVNPDADLPAGDLCTVTVSAASVTDQDANDPPDNMAADYSFSFTVFTANVCEAVYTPAYVIQGSGAATTFSGQVTTQGVVVGDYEGPSTGPLGTLRGFYLQDPTGDGNADTSDAIFVFNGDRNEVALGDVVRVTGSVGEFQGQTQISTGGGANIVNCGTGTVAPVDVTLPFPSADYAERYEGMLVRLPQTLYVTEHFQLGRFGQVVLSSGARLRQPTNDVEPGGPALALQAANNLNRIILDDALQSQNPDPILFARGGQPLSASNTLRGGDTATGIVGVLGFTWAGNSASGNAYRVRPVSALNGFVNFEPANLRPESLPAVGGSLKVVGMNLLNYFNTFDGLPDTVDNCTFGVGGAPADCRGADTQAEFDRQWPKTVAAITAIDADIIGIVEIENDGYGQDSAIQHLVNRLNEATSPGAYAFVDVDALSGQVNALGTDAIKVGLIYKPGTVTPVGTTAVLNSDAFVNGGDGSPRNRATVAQAFTQNSTGETLIVNVNHFKSKGSACDAPDAGDGQGNCNAVRVNAATQLAAWLAGNPTGTGDPDVLIVGDLNSYAKEDPITTLLNSGYTNLISQFVGPDAYSYVFDGQWGYLDHALASSTLTQQTAGVVEYHINADEPNVLDYNTDFKTANLITSLYAPDQYRISDHDPVVVGLNLDSNATLTIVLDAQPDSPLNFNFTGSLGDFILDDGRDTDVYTNTKVFANLPADPSQVVLNVPSLWYLTDLTCDSPNAVASVNKALVTVTPALGEDITCTFTTKLTSAIIGYVYNDRNANGRLDWRDLALRGWTVSLFDDSGELVGEEISNRSGQVLFFPVKPGSVTLCETLQDGWTNTQPGVINATYGRPCYTGDIPPASIVLALFGNTRESTGRAIEVGDAVLNISGVISADVDESFTLSEDEITVELPTPLFTDEIFLPFIDR